MTDQLCLKWNNHLSTFNRVLKKIHLEPNYSDCTILCQGNFYPAHQLVLSTCSEYFEQIFTQCFQLNKHPFIIVKDVEPLLMEFLLNFMYKGEINVPEDTIPELIKAAEVFKIKGIAVPDVIQEDSISNEKSQQKTEKRSLSPTTGPNKRKEVRYYLFES